jgi:molybdopterin-guanine dinucleotide biosynthesis protein
MADSEQNMKTVATGIVPAFGLSGRARAMDSRECRSSGREPVVPAPVNAGQPTRAQDRTSHVHAQGRVAALRLEGPLMGLKASFVTRRADVGDAAALVRDRTPQAGDLLLARVDKLGQLTRLQLAGGRRAQLYPGDRLLLCYGNRYAPDQFEAEVPGNLDSCHLITAGGVAARMLTRHQQMKMPTVISPLGLLADAQGEVINLRRYGLPAVGSPGAGAKPTIGVLGTSMNAGKTTAVVDLIRGLVRSGRQVAAIKATGTGSGNDPWAMEDAGASLVLDFTDMGYPSTYRVPAAEIETLFCRLLAQAQQSSADVVVVEVADGLLHQETAELVGSRRFIDSVERVLFCAGDALGAVAGIQWLEQRGIDVFGIAGTLTASPLAVREARQATRLPVLTRAGLSDPAIADVVRWARA